MSVMGKQDWITSLGFPLSGFEKILMSLNGSITQIGD